MKRRSFISMALAGVGTLLWPLGPSRAGVADATVYKDPNCGCCNKWIDHLKRAGFMVEAYNRDDMLRLAVAKSLQRKFIFIPPVFKYASRAGLKVSGDKNRSSLSDDFL